MPASIIGLLRQEIELYQQLLEEQKGTIELYLQGDLTAIEASQASQNSLRSQIARLQEQLQNRLAGSSLTAVVQALESLERAEADRLLRDFQRLIQEIQWVKQRNQQFVKRSLSFTGAMLQEIFSDASNYTSQGYVQAVHSGVQRKERKF